jgi:dihydroflavonol-4-reductase
MTRAAVTGAAGFIGGQVVRALLEAGYEVRALHLPSDDLRNLQKLPVEFLPCDVTDLEAVRAAFRGVDRVFHLAAVYSLWKNDAARMQAVNVEGTRKVLRAAKEAGVERVVHTSSIARFGGQGPSHRATEESPFALGPTGDVYSQTKWASHELARQAAEEGQDVVLVAPTGPIGPGDVGPTPTGRLLLQILRLPAPVVVDSETNFADVRDMARGHVLAAERGRRGEAYLLGGEDFSLQTLAEKALRIAGLSRPVRVAPFFAAEVAARLAVLYADRSSTPPLLTPAAVSIARLGLKADCSKAKRELGLEVRPIERSLEDALSWFAENGYLGEGRLLRQLRARLA